MPEFNLMDEDWIPCIDLEGKQVEYGIRDTLFKAHELQEICDDSPLVTVAIHRLLLAILYRAFQGPRTFGNWRKIFDSGSFENTAVAGYCNRWRMRFDLLDDAHPFFQMGALETKNPISVCRLATECASGNNATLFDHSDDDIDVEWPFPKTARQLVACQSFALGFGKSGNARINGKDEILPYSSDAISLRGMTIWLQGSNLFETLTLNFVPEEDDSFPPWELDNSNCYRDTLEGKEKHNYSSFGIVDRYTWQSRLIRLLPENGAVSRMYFTQGRTADKSNGDPMKTYRVSKKEGISLLALSSEKAAWRDAHAILMLPNEGSLERRPECFNLLARARSSSVLDDSRPFLVQIVGLASAPNKAGKFLLWRHERMPIPAVLADDNNMIERVGALLKEAEQIASVLNKRIRYMANLFLAPPSGDGDGRKPDEKDVALLAEKLDPRPAYWSRLEGHFYRLLEDLPGDWDSSANDWKADNEQRATRAWRESVKREAQRALEESTRMLGTTARAIQAIARVRTGFSDNDLKPPRTTTKDSR